MRLKKNNSFKSIEYTDSQHIHSSNAILDDIKGNGGLHSLNVTSQWLLYVTTSNSSQFSWKSGTKVYLKTTES